MNELFNLSVSIMIHAGHILGISYQAVNIWLFVIIQQLMIIILIAMYLRMRKKQKRASTVAGKYIFMDMVRSGKLDNFMNKKDEEKEPEDTKES